MLVDLLIAVAFVIGLDQGSKQLAVGRAGAGRGRAFGPLRLRYVVADGFGLRLIGNPWVLVSLWIVAVAGCLLVALRGPTADLALTPIGIGAAIGGSASNLLDRLRYGGAVDIVHIRGWSVFNLADVAIVGGVLVTVCTFVATLHGGS